MLIVALAASNNGQKMIKLVSAQAKNKTNASGTDPFIVYWHCFITKILNSENWKVVNTLKS